jgi:hypothetical protein
MRRTLASGLVLSMLVASAAMGAEPKTAAEDLAEATARLGRAPDFCATLSEGHQICTWHRGAEHVVCELGARDLLPQGCIGARDDEGDRTYATTQPERGRGGAPVAAPEPPGRLEDVIRRAGSGPRSCRYGSTLSCSWSLAFGTLGWGRFAPYAVGWGRPLQVFCEFPHGTGGGGPGSCSSRIGDSPAAARVDEGSTSTDANASHVPELLRACELASDRVCRARGLSSAELEVCTADRSYACVSGRE